MEGEYISPAEMPRFVLFVCNYYLGGLHAAVPLAVHLRVFYYKQKRYIVFYNCQFVVCNVDVCSQPAKQAGGCTDYVVRYSYSRSLGLCQAFYYGGCEGNDNRFESTDECEEKCMRSTTTKPTVDFGHKHSHSPGLMLRSAVE